MNKIQTTLELVGIDDVAKIIKIDAPQLTTSTVSEFCKANLLGYYVLINTWLIIIKTYSKFGWMRLLDRIHHSGLIEAIRICQDAARSIVTDQVIEDQMCREILANIKHTLGVPKEDTTSINQAYRATALFLMRYPKRFSPLLADKVESQSLTEFIQRENRTKLLTRRGYSSYVIDKVRTEMASLIDWDAVNKEIDQALADPTNLVFTPGVCRDSKSSLGSKLMAVANELPEFFINPFGIPYAGVYPTVEPEVWEDEEMRLVNVATVPKDYKSARIIAPETVVRQGRAGVIADIITRHLPKNIPLRDQSVNGSLAKAGSINRLTATIDLSAASDSISKELFWEVFPSSFTDRVYPFLGTHWSSKGTIRIMHMMSTSGNALTFVLESLIFCAIDMAAERTARLYDACIISDDCIQDLPDASADIPSVYGDDQVVWAAAYETTRDFLQMLGFIVNESKSFWKGPYRESCGEEWYDGIDCHTVYFPRFPIIGEISRDRVGLAAEWRRDSRNDVLVDSLTSLVSLQHRLYYPCYEAARFIHEVIRSSHPRMTTSCPGEDTPDCWEFEDVHKDAYAPKARFEYDHDKYGHVRTRKLINEQSDVPRVKRYAPGVEYVEKREASTTLKRLYDIYKYQEFLKHGPRYDSDLDSILGVTAKPRDMKEINGSPNIVWKLRVTAE